jgi:nucleoside-diphosphate-sugar epimerase
LTLGGVDAPKVRFGVRIAVPSRPVRSCAEPAEEESIMAKVLFVGGTGQISLPCVAQAVEAGHEVTVFNRGKSDVALPAGVRVIVGDMKDAGSYRQLGEQQWDVVCQFMVFTPEQMAQDIAVFTGQVGQYIFISSASVYEKTARHYVITEQTPAVNPFWKYSQDKIACEAMLQASIGLPWTIVRPSHTVRTGLPTMMGPADTTVQRLLDGKPIIVAGDGSTPWTLTRSVDFAAPFIRLFGNERAMGEIFHITSDRGYTWDAIHNAIAAALGVQAQIVHVPTDTLVRFNPEWEGPLRGDKSWSALFDNSKIKSVAGDFECAEVLETVLEEPLTHLRRRMSAGLRVDADFDGMIERIAAAQSALGR